MLMEGAPIGVGDEKLKETRHKMKGAGKAKNSRHTPENDHEHVHVPKWEVIDLGYVPLSPHTTPKSLPIS